MREWKFRAWDPEAKKMYSPEDLEEPDASEETPKTIYGKISDGVLRGYDVKHNPPLMLELMQSTNWYDMKQNEIFEGDILEAQSDGKLFLVGWDDMTASFVLWENEESYIPGGAYITDLVTIKGNVFENGFNNMQFIQRELHYRAWDPESKKMYQPEQLKDPEEDMTFSIYGYLSFGALYIYDFILDPPMELIPMQITGWKDAKGKDVFEGDIMEIDGELGQVSWSDEVGGFMFMANEGSLYPGDAEIAARVEVVGNIYENEDVVPQLKW